MNLVTIGPADVLAPGGDKPSPGIVLTEKLCIFSSKFPGISIILHHLYGPNGAIQNGGLDFPWFFHCVILCVFGQQGIMDYEWGIYTCPPHLKSESQLSQHRIQYFLKVIIHNPQWTLLSTRNMNSPFKPGRHRRQQLTFKLIQPLCSHRTIGKVLIHYSDIIWEAWHLKSLANQLFVHQLLRDYNKHNSTVCPTRCPVVCTSSWGNNTTYQKVSF